MAGVGRPAANEGIVFCRSGSTVAGLTIGPNFNLGYNWNNAASTLVRLAQMGIESFNIASSVILITAQRLARKLCPHCKRAVEIPREALTEAGFEEEDLDGSWQPYAPHGCEHCSGTGYKGRTGVFEVLSVSDAMSRIIMRNGSAHDIADQARVEGMRTLRRSGLLKVKSGITSLDEIEAVTND